MINPFPPFYLPNQEKNEKIDEGTRFFCGKKRKDKRHKRKRERVKTPETITKTRI